MHKTLIHLQRYRFRNRFYHYVFPQLKESHRSTNISMWRPAKFCCSYERRG